MSFVEGQLIDVPADTPEAFAGWLARHAEFARWLENGTLTIVRRSWEREDATARPLAETTMALATRPFRRRGRATRPSASGVDPA